MTRQTFFFSCLTLGRPLPFGSRGKCCFILFEISRRCRNDCVWYNNGRQTSLLKSAALCVSVCVCVCVCVRACVCVPPTLIGLHRAVTSPSGDPLFAPPAKWKKRRNSPPPSQSQENGTISLSPPSSSDCFTGLYRVLPNLNEFQWVLLRFTSFYFVLLGFTGFYRVLLGINEFSEFYRVLPSFTEFYRVLPGTRRYWA